MSSLYDEDMSVSENKWHDICPEQLASIHAAVIEMCAEHLEYDASFNDRVAADEKDFLNVRLDAHNAARTKRICAQMLRSLKDRNQ